MVPVFGSRRVGSRPRYSSSSSFRSCSICCRSKPVTPIGLHFSEGRTRAANISFRTAFSPYAFGMTFMCRRSSPNSLSSRFVVRVALRCLTGIRRCAMQV